MSYYKTCPFCGAHLDPGELCNCIPSLYARLTPEDRALVDGEIHRLLEMKKTAQGAANTQDGKVEKVQPVSASYNIKETEELQA